MWKKFRRWLNRPTAQERFLINERRKQKLFLDEIRDALKPYHGVGFDLMASPNFEAQLNAAMKDGKDSLANTQS